MAGAGRYFSASALAVISGFLRSAAAAIDFLQRKPGERVFPFHAANGRFRLSEMEVAHWNQAVPACLGNEIQQFVLGENCPIDTEVDDPSGIDLLRPVINRGDKIAAGFEDARYLTKNLSAP